MLLLLLTDMIVSPHTAPTLPAVFAFYFPFVWKTFPSDTMTPQARGSCKNAGIKVNIVSRLESGVAMPAKGMAFTVDDLESTMAAYGLDCTDSEFFQRKIPHVRKLSGPFEALDICLRSRDGDGGDGLSVEQNDHDAGKRGNENV